jgi:uncharacterized protein (TIGR03435 family)
MRWLCVTLLATAAILAQPLEKPRFDAASIKPNPTQSLRHVILPPNGGRLSTNRATLRLLIQRAYDLQTFQVQGGPEWMNSQAWDVEAKAEGNPGRKQVWLMLQSLLEHRFQLKIHRETKEMPVYMLEAAKKGFTIPKPEPGSCVAPDAIPPPRESGKPPVGRCGDLIIAAENGTLYLQGWQVGTADLAKTLSDILLEPIVDRSGVTEKFDLAMPFAFDDLTVGLTNPRRPGDPSDPAGVPSLGVALQQKLGLRLEKGRAPMEILVVDHAERASGN